MALFWEEWKKCWRGRTAPLCLLALLAAAVCLGVYTGVDALSDMDRYYQPMHNGPREAARQKEFAGRWAGRLEAEELEKALKNLQHAYAQNGNTQEQNGVKAFTPQARRQWYDPVEAVVPLMESVLNISGAYEGAGAQEDGLYTADASQLRRFYELRHEKVLASVEFRQQNGSLNEAQADALLKREAQLQTPFAYGYTKGFSEYTRAHTIVAYLAAFFACILCAPVFAGEVKTGADAVLKAARHGRMALARAKVCAALCAASALYAAGTAAIAAAQLAFSGTDGWNAAVQVSSEDALYLVNPVNMLQCEAGAILYGYICCLGMAGVSLCFSACLRSSFAAMAASVCILILPEILRFLPGMDVLRQLLPGNVSTAFAFMQGEMFFDVAGRPVPMQVLQLAVPLALALCGAAAAARCWRRRQTV